MEQFEIGGKSVRVYPSAEAGGPIIYLNSFEEEGAEIYNILRRNNNDFTLVTIGDLDWNADMSPWEIPPISRNDTSFTGGADKYLMLLTGQIVPTVESFIGKISWRGIAGYSLAGLFAVYSLYCTDIFVRAASISGSLWYPKFKEFVFKNSMKICPDFMYFSLGDKESKTRNVYMRTVQKNTEEIEKYYRDNGIKTCFELNCGNHFQNAAGRAVKGISHLLNG